MSGAWVGAMNALSAVWADNMVRACWQGGLFLLLVWGVCRLFPRLPAAFRGGLWWLACLKLLLGLVWVVPVTWAVLPAPSIEEARTPASEALSTPSAPTEQHARIQRAMAEASAAPAATAPSRLRPADPIPTTTLTVAPPSATLASLLLGLWLMGVALRLCLLAWHGRSARRLVREARPCRQPEVLEAAEQVARLMELRRLPRLLCSDAVAGPLLVGIPSPVILLPEHALPDLSADELRMALAHEFAHVQRGDLWLGVVPTLASALFCFHPLVWLASREFELCREEACDAQTLLRTQQPAEEYGRLILRFLARNRQAEAGVALGATHHAFRRRLSMLKHVSSQAARPMRVALALLAVLALVGLVPWRVIATPQEEKDPLANDARLERRVTVNAEGIPVSDLVPLLAKKTGLPLEVWSGAADDKVIVYSAARPLKEVMADLALLFNDRWIHGKTNTGREYYALTRTETARRYEEGLIDADYARVVIQLEEQVKALEETPDQLAKRPKDDPIRQRLEDHVTRLATQLYAGLSVQQRGQLFELTTLHVPFAMLPPDLQAAVRDQYAANLAQLQRQKEEHPEQVGTIGQPDDIAKQGLEFSVAHYFGETYIDAHPVGLIAQIKVQEQWELPAHGDPYTKQPVPKDAALPAADAVGAGGVGKSWPERLKSLAEHSGMTVMADFYRSKTVTQPYEGAEANANAPASTRALDAFCYSPGYLWWAHNKTLLFRKRDWYTQKQYEVPEPWLRTLCKNLRTQKNVPTYSDVFHLLDLTNRQIVGLSSLKYRDEAPGQITAGEWDEHDIMGLKEWLELAKTSYANPERTLQTFQLVDKDGPELAVLPVAALNNTQRSLLTSFVVKQTTAPHINPSDQIYLRLHCTGYPLPDKPGFHDGFSDVDMTMQTEQKRSLKAGEIFQGYFMRISLPTEIPDDRSAKTRVEIK
ncbi:MAG TPA: M56 family metallopeptidase [Chthonomonadaceae bacterium]|nr:M56 family metallopeptidase [Chthonomonadaceae bacterium]